ncbi:MAG: hypothetical protein OXG13_20610 [Gemmatimonadaceae bacterium]|nr:hypothetical protein [Gemmatimonadaceae bacterium]
MEPSGISLRGFGPRGAILSVLAGIGALLPSLAGAQETHSWSWGPRTGIEIPEVPRVQPDRMFLRRPAEPYRNYAHRERMYTNYPTILSPYRDPKRFYYGPLGNRLAYGIPGYDWVETRGLGPQGRGSSSLAITGNLYHYPGREQTTYRRYFEDVLTVSEQTDSWSGSLTIAQEMRGRFTPLTLKVNAFPGFRLDWGTEQTDLSALFMTWSTVRMGALHMERRVGLLDFGLTYVNAHESFSDSYGHAFSRKGVLRHNQPYPEIIAVKISDDSPDDDRGGPHIVELNIHVNGVLRKDIVPDVIEQIDGVRRTSVGKLTTQGLVRNAYAELSAAFTSSVPTGTTYMRYRHDEAPLYMDYLFFRDLRLHDPVDPDREFTTYVWRDVEFPIEEPWHLAVNLEPGSTDRSYYKDNADEILAERFTEEEVLRILIRNNALNNVFRPLEQSFRWRSDETGPIEVSGDDFVVYYFNLAGQGFVQSVSFDALVANDYKIEVGTVARKRDYDLDDPRAAIDVPYTGRYAQPTLYRTVKRAPGNVQDRSNLQRITFDIGSETGMEIFGADFSTNILGLKIDGEYARSLHHFQYPDGVVGPDPTTPVRAGRRFDRKGEAWYLVVRKEHERFDWGAEYFHMGPEYNTELLLLATPAVPHFNSTLRLMMVDDNDDDDRFPDSWFQQYISGFVHEGVDADGIFPGKDLDGDGRPDTNRNGNRLPDYLEPFLMYDVESDDYVYDLDMNNNDRPDSREDDPEPDYPYAEDLEGWHAIGTCRLTNNLALSLGRLDSRQVHGDGANLMNYGRLSWSARQPRLGQLHVQNTLKRVRDSVPDRVLVSSDFSRGPFGKVHLAGFGYQQQWDLNLIEDELRYRNSWANRFFVQADLSPLRGLRMHHNLRYELNRQQRGVLDDGTFQRSNEIRALSSVHRADYTWRRFKNRLEIGPALKLLLLKRTQETVDVPLADETTVIPIFKASYHVTPKTTFRFGVQGLPFWKYRLKDSSNDWNSFEQNVYVLMMTNRSDYFGYEIVTNAGMTLDSRTYDDPFRGADNTDIMATFVQIVAGAPRQ